MAFLYANSRFTFQNNGTYLPQITRETCTVIDKVLSFCKKPNFQAFSFDVRAKSLFAKQIHLAPITMENCIPYYFYKNY